VRPFTAMLPHVCFKRILLIKSSAAFHTNKRSLTYHSNRKTMHIPNDVVTEINGSVISKIIPRMFKCINDLKNITKQICSTLNTSKEQWCITKSETLHSK